MRRSRAGHDVAVCQVEQQRWCSGCRCGRHRSCRGASSRLCGSISQRKHLCAEQAVGDDIGDVPLRFLLLAAGKAHENLREGLRRDDSGADDEQAAQLKQDPVIHGPHCTSGGRRRRCTGGGGARNGGMVLVRIPVDHRQCQCQQRREVTTAVRRDDVHATADIVIGDACACGCRQRRTRVADTPR